MNMQKLFSGKNLIILAAAALSLGSLSSCSKKKSKSSVTGWNYDDKKMGNFHIAKVKYPKAGPGLVFVQGGSFVMGAKEEDVMEAARVANAHDFISRMENGSAPRERGLVRASQSGRRSPQRQRTPQE